MLNCAVHPATDSPAAWRALAGCCIVAIFGVTALYGSTFGLMMLPMQRELGWSRADIAFSLTLMTLAGPAILPLVGWLIDHVRLRPLVLWGVVLQSLSLAGFGLMHGSVWVYYGLCLAMIVTATGEMQQTDQYGAADVNGIDVEAGLDYQLASKLLLRAAVRLTTLGFTFKGDGVLTNNRDGNTATIDVAGARDTYFGGFASGVYLF